jgi:hypothetical protein
MPLTLREIRAGAVAYLDYVELRENPEVDHGDTNINRDGPFLCVQVVGDRSCWIPLTTQHRLERLLIDKKWRQGGSPKFRATDLYVNDGLNTFVGPTAAFVAAGRTEIPFTAFPRPSVQTAGVEAVLAEIKKQGGPLVQDPASDTQ